MKAKTSYMAGLAMVLALIMSVPSMAAEKKNAATVPSSNAFGQSFGDWLRDYWAWSYSGAASEPLPNGVFFLPVPLPHTNEVWNGKPIGIGEMNVTVKPGTKIVLGILAWLGETYDPAFKIPDDTPFPMSDFLPPNGEAVITLDGVEVINASNLQNFYYGPSYFDPPIMYATPTDYHSTGIIFVQGIGIVLKPLTPGEHTLTLYSWDRWQGLYGPNGQGWFNTWHITVATPKK